MGAAVNSSGWTLNFTADVAAQIFTGAIKTWDDPQILAINPNLTYALPTCDYACPACPAALLWEPERRPQLHTLRAVFWYRNMKPPVPAGQPITVVVRQDSSAATQAFSQWLTVSPSTPVPQGYSSTCHAAGRSSLVAKLAMASPGLQRTRTREQPHL